METNIVKLKTQWQKLSHTGRCLYIYEKAFFHYMKCYTTNNFQFEMEKNY